MDDQAFDVVIVGAGSGGVSLARDLRKKGRTVALVADGFVGGECPYVACMPSKSLLRSARGRSEILTAAQHGAASRDLTDDHVRRAWPLAVARRDSVANHQDDAHLVRDLQNDGVVIVRGFGRLTKPGRVIAGSQMLVGDDVVLDTGSRPQMPDLAGIGAVPTWTSDQALTSPTLPASLIVLGGGAIGCELAQAYSTFSVNVTVIEPAGRILPTEDPEISELMLAVLHNSGVRTVLGDEPVSAQPVEVGARINLKSGESVTAERVLIAVGRKPATDGVGISHAGGTLNDDGSVVVDDRCHAADRLWAIGDVTAVASYTHTANHQAAVVLDALTGSGERRVTPDALPRAVFTEPAVAAAGLTEKQARERGIDVVVAEADLADQSRAGAEGQGSLGPTNASGGLLRLIADRRRGVLVGASAIGPEADSWIIEATLAIRANVPLQILVEVVRPFPTFAEAYTAGYRQLLEALGSKQD